MRLVALRVVLVDEVSEFEQLAAELALFDGH